MDAKRKALARTACRREIEMTVRQLDELAERRLAVLTSGEFSRLARIAGELRALAYWLDHVERNDRLDVLDVLASGKGPL